MILRVHSDFHGYTLGEIRQFVRCCEGLCDEDRIVPRLSRWRGRLLALTAIEHINPATQDCPISAVRKGAAS